MDRPLTSGERLMNAVQIGPWWDGSAFQGKDHPEAERGRPSQDQALLGCTFSVALEMAPDNVWGMHETAERALRALRDCVDKAAAKVSEGTTKADLALFLGDLVQRLNGGNPLDFVPPTGVQIDGK